MTDLSYSWPLILRSDQLTLRPLRLRDRRAWNRVRASNRDWLSKWEATRPNVPGEDPTRGLPSFRAMVRAHRHEGRALRSITLTIWYQGNLVGQISMGGITFGALRGAHIGYWIDQKFANLGITTQAVSIVTKYAFDELFLHRIEINCDRRMIHREEWLKRLVIFSKVREHGFCILMVNGEITSVL
ncbi:MAG: GNAT family N-acetyltransferase [Actinomycetota bacterium]